MYILVQLDSDPLASPVPEHLEIFDERPTTIGVGGDPDNWPSSYAIFEGNPNGGDSALMELVRDRRLLVNAWSH